MFTGVHLTTILSVSHSSYRFASEKPRDVREHYVRTKDYQMRQKIVDGLIDSIYLISNSVGSSICEYFIAKLRSSNDKAMLAKKSLLLNWEKGRTVTAAYACYVSISPAFARRYVTTTIPQIPSHLPHSP